MNDDLIAQLTDPDEDVRDAAREELAMLMDDRIARAFLDVARGHASEEIRADAIIGLGPIIEEAGDEYSGGDDFDLDPDFGPGISSKTFESIISEIRSLYDDESQPTLIRRRALEVLVRDPRPWQTAAIRKHFASDDPSWKRTAVFAMGNVSGFDNDIAAIVASADGDLLYEAVRAAGRREITATAKRIRDLATSATTDTDLRLAAIDALPAVDRNAFDTLEALSRSKDKEIAEAAEAALEELSLAKGLASFDDDEED